MSDPLRDEYVAALEAENEVLRERLSMMETEFGFHNTVPLMFGLTMSESKVMSLLLARDVASKQQLMSAIMLNRGADSEPEKKIVDVYVCKIRKKLKPFGIEIATVWGRGYSLAQVDKAKVSGYLAQTVEAAE